MTLFSIRKTGKIDRDGFERVEIANHDPEGYKFGIGDILELHGLVDYPQFNGELVEITAFRIDGEYGKAYYIKSNNEDLMYELHWVYEIRLREIENA